ncbi:MAG: FapA family protein [Lachnospiraceae bacterium]|nr:FapA family protein [Lachnospiraceae bacterium]
MGERNAYFRLLAKEDGNYLELIPPEGNGKALAFGELQDYLMKRGHFVDKLVIAKAIHDANGDRCEFKLDNKKVQEEAESYNLMISEDKLTCIARFYPPSLRGAELSKDEIVKDLKFKKICFGIHNDVIDDFFKDKKYCTDYVIAEGKPVREGADGRIDYLFNTNPNTRPKLNDDGTVDFFNLQMISPCKAGDVVASLTKADPGEKGVDIFGGYIEPRKVEEPQFRHGNNLKISEDGLSLISEISGNVSLYDDKVFVSNIFEINDVDTSIGNIEYEGDVHVSGNINAGFSVKASGNIEVKGVVEGAYVEAGGDIIIARGMNGMGKGRLKAGRNVVSKFIENAKVEAHGYVHSEAILNSEILSKDNVVVTGKKGFITGGKVHALKNVEAKIIGSSMGAETDIQVGADPTVKLKIASMENEIKANNKKLDQIKPILATLTLRMKKGDKLTPDQLRNLRQLSDEYKVLNDTIDKEMNEYDEFLAKMDISESESVVLVSDQAFPGTRITISEVSMQLKSPAQRARFVKEGADVRIKAY